MHVATNGISFFISFLLGSEVWCQCGFMRKNCSGFSRLNYLIINKIIPNILNTLKIWRSDRNFFKKVNNFMIKVKN